MLAPWECIDAVGERLVPGGVLTCYVATATQLGRVMDTLRAHGGFTEPSATETTVRDWHAEGLTIRPGHGTSAHTGFLVISRRLAPGVSATPCASAAPRTPGAYGPDYRGPRPANIPAELGGAVQEPDAASDATLRSRVRPRPRTRLVCRGSTAAPAHRKADRMKDTSPARPGAPGAQRARHSRSPSSSSSTVR